MEEIVGQAKHTKGQSSSKEGDFVYTVNWKGVFYYELLPENQMINSNKYRSESSTWLKVSRIS